MVVTILEILKYTIPAIIVLIASYLIVQKFLVSELKRKQLALLQESQDITIRLRLQAYERLALYAERIHPRNLIPRVYQGGMTVADLQHALIFNIRTEFEHNLSQQIYVSKQVWDTVRNVKEQEMNLVNQIAKQLNPEASAKELHARMIDYIMSVPGDLPGDIALSIINEEARRILSYGAQG
ncbi:MAG: hypothetical protein EOP56_04335 [Sphingobacteriales bacterium]|nr:MAG: hypothetical protein EOP56_04335 [Sphingobacteriales bacterium]